MSTRVHFSRDACATFIRTNSAIDNLEIPDKSENKEKYSFNYKPFLGFFYTLSASILFGLMSLFVKQLSYSNSGQLSMIRNTVCWIGTLPIAVYTSRKISISKKDAMMLVLRGVAASLAVYFYIAAFRFLPLAEAAVVMATLPAMATIMARIFLKEPCGLVQIFALILTACGLLFSIRFPDLLNKRNDTIIDTTYIKGLASAVASVLIYSMVYVLCRIARKIHFSVQLLFIGFVGMLTNGLITVSTSFFTEPQCGWDMILTMSVGVFGVLGNCAMILAVQVQTAGIASVTRASLDIIIALCFQNVFFSVEPNIYTACGVCLVLSSLSIIGIKNWLSTLPEESKMRKTLRCFLI